jgi:hypothetical protein
MFEGTGLVKGKILYEKEYEHLQVQPNRGAQYIEAPSIRHAESNGIVDFTVITIMKFLLRSQIKHQ